MDRISKESLLKIAKKSGIGILIFNSEENLIFINDWVLRYIDQEVENVFQKNISDVFPEIIQSRLHLAIQLCLKNLQYSILTHTLNKSSFPLYSDPKNKTSETQLKQHIHIIPIPSDPVHGTLCMVQITDVTQHVLREELLREQMVNAKQAQEIAIKASKAKSDFLASMSHEIRTPLNSILGMTEILNETQLTSDQKEYLEVLGNSGKALYNIINDILDFARIESGKIEIDSKPFSLNDLIAESLSIFLLRAGEKGIQLGHHIQEKLPPNILGDRVRIQQILINLVGNAMKFTHHGEIQLSIQLSSDNRFLQFSVRDTGIGIPESKLQSVFESFTQADSSTTRKYGGTGLGLTITKKLVDLMQGNIWLESKEGAGSTFHFEIPFHPYLMTDMDEENFISVYEPPPASEFPPMKILVVDDSPENVLLIKTFLKKYPFEVWVAENGLEAFEDAKEEKFDVILMDMQMPVMDGFEATKKIRDWEKENPDNRNSEVPIIVVSANVLKEDIKRSLDMGCTSYLTKPVKKADLLKLIYFFRPQ